jgi:hypothetical protein
MYFYYNSEVLEIIKERHEKERHEENKEEYQKDPSCPKCYSTEGMKIDEWFKGFWKIFQKSISEAMTSGNLFRRNLV